LRGRLPSQANHCSQHQRQNRHRGQHHVALAEPASRSTRHLDAARQRPPRRWHRCHLCSDPRLLSMRVPVVPQIDRGEAGRDGVSQGLLRHTTGEPRKRFSLNHSKDNRRLLKPQFPGCGSGARGIGIATGIAVELPEKRELHRCAVAATPTMVCAIVAFARQIDIDGIITVALGSGEVIILYTSARIAEVLFPLAARKVSST
jgi:hypothetical protein